MDKCSGFGSKSGAGGVRWVREWVPQDLLSPGGKCSLLKWVTEDTLKALKEKCNETELETMEPESTTEVLFLCTYEGCGKTFIDAGTLKKHAHIHGERQHVCHYRGCGKKFLDSSKLKRHFLIHTGERAFVCPHEGCGKAFSLDFNLRSHMKTHSLENYHVCPFPECGKRYTHEYKLKTHMKAHNEKKAADVNHVMRHTPIPEKRQNTPKPPVATSGAASVDRPYACPYEGCRKAYIHEYKLNLHLRREHPGHNAEENDKNTPAADEASDQDTAPILKGGVLKSRKRTKPPPKQKMPPAKVLQQKGSSSAPAHISAVKHQLPTIETYEEEDSEETEEDGENVEGRWQYREMDEDDEETEDED